MESQHRAFLFGGFEREIVLVFLTVFHQLLQSLFIVAWETLTDRHAPGGYSGLNKTNIADSLRIAAMTQDLDWFIRFILFGRIVMVVIHTLGIPSFVQMAGCLALALYLPLPSREGRLSPGAISIGYMLMLIGAYVAPDSWQDRQDSFQFCRIALLYFSVLCEQVVCLQWVCKLEQTLHHSPAGSSAYVRRSLEWSLTMRTQPHAFSCIGLHDCQRTTAVGIWHLV